MTPSPESVDPEGVVQVDDAGRQVTVGQWVRTPGSPGYVEVVGPEKVAVRNGHGILDAWRYDEVEVADRG